MKKFFDACGVVGGISIEKRSVYDLIQQVSRIKHRGGDGIGILFQIDHEALEEESKEATYLQDQYTSLPTDVRPIILMIQIPQIISKYELFQEIINILKKWGLEFIYGIPISNPTQDIEQVVIWRIVSQDNPIRETSTPLSQRLWQARQELIQLQ